jgi:hypothetical protein
MLEAHGAPAVLAALAEACADRAGFLRQLKTPCAACVGVRAGVRGAPVDL